MAAISRHGHGGGSWRRASGGQQCQGPSPRRSRGTVRQERLRL